MTRKAEQSERTRAALVAAARVAFAERGFAAASAEEIAAACGITTGAVYHHYGSKRGLFLAAFETIEADLTAAVAAAAAREADPWTAFQTAALAFLDACVEPEVRQVLLIDGRSVLGWEEWHSVMSRYGLGLTRTAVGGLVESGLLPAMPVEALATLLFGALNEAALAIATAPDAAVAREETASALRHLVAGLAK